MSAPAREAPPNIRDSRIAAIVLAGGRASRLGQPKPSAIVGGETLLSRTLRAVGESRTAVIGPPELQGIVGRWANASLARESPPFGGPVAAIAAGCALLDTSGPGPEWLILLACDLPRASEAVQALAETVPGLSDDEAGACLIVDDRPQWLCGIYRAQAVRAAIERLLRAGGVDSVPVRALLGPLTLRRIDGLADIAFDIDTPADLFAANERISR
jgi:molybdopterin-guanine dinucleotide biosynthesis protein A